MLDHKDREIWNTIQNESISPNGEFIMYFFEKGTHQGLELLPIGA